MGIPLADEGTIRSVRQFPKLGPVMGVAGLQFRTRFGRRVHRHISPSDFG